MQPYVNPNYFQQTQPMYQPYQPQTNPYLDRMYGQNQVGAQMSLSNISAAQMPGTLQGKIVDSVDVVRATDIPMDGNSYYFPKADGTEVFSKRWLPNGNTEILTYKPILDTKSENANILSPEEQKTRFEAFESVLSGISEKVNEMYAKIDEMSAKKTGRPKKEIEEE